MDPQPMGKFLGICVLAAAVGGLAGGLQLAQGPAAVARVPRPAQGLALLPQRITFDPPQDAVVGQPVRLSASTDADANANENLVVSFRSDTPTVCTVSGSRVTTITAGPCDITAFQGGSAVYAAAQASGSFQVIAHEVRSAQRIVFGPMPGTTVGVPVVLTASSRTLVTKGEDSDTKSFQVNAGHQTQTITFLPPPAPQPKAKGLLNADPISFLVPGWQKHREIIAAARRTVADPGSIELVDLAMHEITATQRPAVNLLVDNRQTATVELGVSVVFTVSALVAGIRGGRLVAVHSGRCNVTATLAVEDTKVISRQIAFELPGIIPLGRGIALLAGHDHSAGRGEQTSQASVA